MNKKNLIINSCLLFSIATADNKFSVTRHLSFNQMKLSFALENCIHTLAAILIFLMPLLSHASFPDEIFHKPYHLQVIAIDSVRKAMDGMRQKDFKARLTELQSAAKEKGDEQFFIIVRIARLRHVVTEEHFNSGFEKELLALVGEAENSGSLFLKADAIQLVADYWRENKKYVQA